MTRNATSLPSFKNRGGLFEHPETISHFANNNVKFLAHSVPRIVDTVEFV